ncbi:MAG: DUF4170 domain-containing protein, partial [Alphaproteobacteria bacterium]|nr:DUF4170 domain-containing protein [Alphaproteobacteria bacterium]
YLVMGGQVADPAGTEFTDLTDLDIRGVFPSYDEALTTWRGAAQETVDQAFVKYMIVRLR